MMFNLLQEQPAGGDQLLLGCQRGEPCGDEIGIDESGAWGHLRAGTSARKSFFPRHSDQR